MKKRLAIIIAIVLLVLAALGLWIGLGGGRLTGKSENPGAVEKGDTETELLFGFDSREEILGASVYLCKLFGETKINTENAYITQGEGSWLVKPEGEYALDGYPYLRLKCEDSTFQNSDFDDYDKLLLDFYNASDEAVEIQWYFTMLNPDMAYEETPKHTYTLEPNAWTTCEFDLAEVDYNVYFYPETVGYMYLKFFDKKETAGDIPDEIYIDNLRGHLSDTVRERTDFAYDALEGITFERAEERYAFSQLQANGIKRTSYKDAMLKPKDESFGKYCLEVDATGATWPWIIFDVGQSFEKDMFFTYNIYIQVDEAQIKDATYYMEHMAGDVISTYLGSTSKYQFNEWIEVTSYLPAEESVLKFYANLDKNNTGKSWFASDVPVKVYLDNVRIYEPEAGVSLTDTATKQDDGTIVLKDAYNGDGQVRYIFNMDAKKGQVLYFDLDVAPTGQQVYFCVLGCDITKEGWTKEIWADRVPAWSETKAISAKVNEDTDVFTIIVMYESEGVDWSKNTATISNLRIGEAPPSDEITVSEDGTVTLTNRDGNNQVSYTLHKAAKAGQKLRFDMTISPSGQKANFWVLGCDTAKDGWKNEWWGGGVNTWNETRSFTVSVGEDTDVFTILTQFESKNQDLSKNVVTISNIQVVDDDTVTVERDGTVILANKDGNNQVSYTFHKTAKVGQRLRFDMTISPTGQKANFWVLGCDTTKDGWKNEWWGEGVNAWNETRSFEVSIQEDTDAFTILTQFESKDSDLSKNVVTISNIKLIESDEITVADDGTVTIKNRDGNNWVEYYFDVTDKNLKAGDIVSVMYTLSEKENVWSAVFVNGAEKWADNVDSTTRTIQYTLEEDCTSFRIMLKSNTVTADWDNTITVSGLAISHKDQVTENQDGTFSIENKDGNNWVEYYFDVTDKELKAGDTVAVSFSLAQAGPTNVWSALFINGKENMADNITGTTRTITATLAEDCTTLMILVKNFNVDKWENTVTISPITITRADRSTVAEDGTITVVNSDGDANVYCTFSGLDIKAGDTVTFTVNPSAGNANGWIGIEGFKDGASVNWDWQDNFTGTSYTNSYIAGGERDTLKFLYKIFNGNLGDVTVSFKITITKADQSTTAEDGTVTVTNRDGNETVYCTFSDLDIKEGDTVTFTVNPSAGNANGWIGIEGFKDGTSIDWDWQDNLSGTSYTNSFTAGGERDTLKFLYKTFNGNLGDVTVSFKITVTKAD